MNVRPATAGRRRPAKNVTVLPAVMKFRAQSEGHIPPSAGQFAGTIVPVGKTNVYFMPQ